MNSFEINAPDVVAETIDGEAVVINLERGIYFSIRDVGLTIWTGLLDAEDPDRIVQRVTFGYDTGKADVAADVGHFVDRLLEEGLIRVRAEPAGPSGELSADVARSGAALAYVPPSLEKYTDMEALLLLDPIHDVDDAGWPHRS